MPNFQYRALSPAGDLVSGTLSAPDLAEVTRRIEYLGLIPVEATPARGGARRRGPAWPPFAARPRAEDVTIFSGDLALLLRTGARINDALELLAADADIGRMRPIAAALAASVLSGESFGEAIAGHPGVFPPIYAALIRVGEASGTLIVLLEALAAERQRAEALRRRLTDALRYPAFLLIAAGGVLIFFLSFVLPQFAGVFRDFNVKLDPLLVAFLGLSSLLHENLQALCAGLLCFVLSTWFLARQSGVRRLAAAGISRLPLIRSVVSYRRAAPFCRNLGLLASSGVALSASLRLLAEMMGGAGGFIRWSNIADRVRQGGKLSDALSEERALPPMAVRTLRLGEESGQLPMLAGRIADFYEVKLQRSLDRMVGVVGPAAIIAISLIVGGLIVSVMTALLSVNQVLK